ncbi:hypothetical protein EON65_28045 [archaeon]|nr:MAG: hypothetical protein EON65_28045 [archaeon]
MHVNVCVFVFLFIGVICIPSPHHAPSFITLLPHPFRDCQVSSLQSELSSLQALLSSQSSQSNELSTLRIQHSSLSNELSALRTQHSALEQEGMLLRVHVSDLEGQVSKLTTENNDLRNSNNNKPTSEGEGDGGNAKVVSVLKEVMTEVYTLASQSFAPPSIEDLGGDAGDVDGILKMMCKTQLKKLRDILREVMSSRVE